MVAQVSNSDEPSAGKEALRQVGVIVAGLLLLGIAAVVIPGSGWIDSILLALAAIAALVALFVRSKITPPEKDSPGPPEPESPTPDDIKQAEQAVYIQYGKEVVTYFVQLLTGMPLYLARVAETAEPRTGNMRMETSLTLRMNAESLKYGDISSILVPLNVTKRGVLYNQLRVRDGNGNIAPTLSQQEVRGLLAAAVRILYQLAQNGVGMASQTARDQKVLETLIVRVLCHTEKISKKKLSEIQSALSELDQLDNPLSTYWRNQIRRLCDTFSQHYLTVVEVRKPEMRTLFLSYSYEAPTDRYGYTKTERRRARFGLNPASADVVLTRLFQAESYHFQMAAPGGQYVFHHKLERVSTNVSLKQEDFVLGGKQQYVRTSFGSKRTSAHLYVRRQGDKVVDDNLAIKSIIYFRETPPGALGVAAILAIVSALLQIFIAVSHVGLDPSTTHGSTDVTAFLLTVPAFVAVTIGGWTSMTSAVRSSLVTYLGMLCVVGLALLAAVAYVWDSETASDHRFPLHLFNGSVVVQLSYPWAALAGISTILAIFMALQAHRELRYFLSS